MVRKYKSNIINKEKLIKIIALLLFAFIFFIIYLSATNYLQKEKIYHKSKDWFYYSLYQGYAPQECFVIEPNYLVFNNEKDFFEVDTGFERRCNFSYSITWFNVESMDNYFIDNPKNLTIHEFRNISEPNRLRIIVNSSDMEPYEFYPIRIYFMLNESFFNYYDLHADGSNIEQFRLDYDNSIKGLESDESSFAVLEGNLKKELPIWRGLSKRFYFEGKGRILIRFSPKSKFWALFQKFLDTFILGFTVIFLYEIFNIAIIQSLRIRKKR